MKVAMDLMFDRSRLGPVWDNLVQEPRAMMTAITDAPRHAREPNLERGAERVWKKDRNIEGRLPAQEPRPRDERTTC